jgi:DNA-binding transcriptional MocR family regulator
MAHVDVEEFVSRLGCWQSRSGPTYRKLAEAVREAVASGQFSLGASIPAERKLAEALAVSRTTVVGAYETLRSDGWIESVQGSGTRVSRAGSTPAVSSPRPPISTRRSTMFRGLIETRASTISFLGLHLPALSPEFEEALEEVTRDARSLLRHHGYTGLGLPALREAIAAHLTESGLATRAEEVLVTHGAQQAIGIAAAVLLRPGDAVVLEDPTYLGAIDVFTSAGARLLPVPVGSEGVRLDRLRETLSREGPKLLYLMPTFQNPVGTVLSSEARREVVRVAEEHGATILEDETLSDLSFDRKVPPPLAAFSRSGRVISVGSLSKLIWGGLRVGWLRAPEPLLAPFASLKVMNDLGNSSVSQALAVRLLRRVREIRRKRREQIQERFDLLSSELSSQLPDWTWKRPLGGLSIWVRLPRGDADDFAPVALRHGVAILPGSTCSPSNRCAEYLRLPFCLEPQEIRDGVRRLARAWRSYDPAPRGAREGLVVV